MTRKARQEIERTLEDLEPEDVEREDGFEHFLAMKDPTTGEYRNQDGEVVDPEEESVRLVVNNTIVETDWEADAK